MSEPSASTAPALAVESVPLERLFPGPANPRTIGEDAVVHVAASIRRFGWQQPIVARKSGMIIAGHTRALAAKRLGHTMVPVVWFHGSELEATAYLISDNRLHQFTSWNDTALASLLKMLREEDGGLVGVGFEPGDIDELLEDIGDPDAGGGAVLDPGALEPPEHPTTRRGDLWLIGPHRLHCGDSTVEKDVERLLGGERPLLMATDPPYLVDYDGGNHPADHHKKAGRKAPKKRGSEVGNRHWDAYVDHDSSVEFFASFVRVALLHLDPRAPIYQWHASKRLALVEEAWRRNGLLVHQTINWVKSRAVLTRSHFSWQSEPCLYGWVEGKQPETDRRPPPGTSNVWQIEQAGENDGIHPTQKPRQIFSQPMLWHLRKGELAYEPFSGSGTSLVAAHETGRRCFAMELSPAFVDAALLRFQKATGIVATLDGDGRTFEDVAKARARVESAPDGEG
jgi:DNA modification methylase